MSSCQGQQPPTGPGHRSVSRFKAAPTSITGLAVGGLGLLVVVFSFMPYYRVTASCTGYGDTHSTNAWDSWVSILGIVLLILGSATVAVASSGLLDSSGRNLALGGAAATSLAPLCFLVSMLYWPDYSDWRDAVSGTGVSMSQTRGVGLYLVLLVAAATAGLSWTIVRLPRHAWTKAEDDSLAAGLGFGGQAPRGDGQSPAAPGDQQAAAPLPTDDSACSQ